MATLSPLVAMEAISQLMTMAPVSPFVENDDNVDIDVVIWIYGNNVAIGSKANNVTIFWKAHQ